MRQRILSAAIVLVLLSSAGQFTTGQASTDDTRSLEFTGYLNYSDVKGMLGDFAAEYDDITDLRVLGSTYEGRDILALRVTDNPEDEENEPDVLIIGGHHAEELPSVEVPLYVLDFLVTNYDTNGSVRRLVDTRDIWFVPMLNPDGREHVLNGSTYWRKNRRPIDTDGDGTPEGYGVDLNRNYGHLWGQLPGASHNVNDRDYCGPEAFSENETQAIRDLAFGQLFDISLSYHTYGEVIYYPWNNNIDSTNPDSGLLSAIASELGERTGYTPTQGYLPPLGYPTTGDSDDWLYADTDCMAFTIELGTEYQPPLSEVEQMCGDNLEAALYAIDIADDPERAQLPDWTFMAYMAADPNDPFDSIIDAAVDDLNDMEFSGSTSEVNIIALHDSLPYGDSELYRILKDPNGLNGSIISESLNDYGAIIDPVTRELDMSDPGVLRSFVEWTVQNYPAQHYFLDIWSHGRGILRGFASDKTSAMQTKEIGTALEGFDLDVVGFDACSMGHFETAHELIGIADVFIGSEAEEPIAGWDYKTSISRLVDDPNITPYALADAIVGDYLAMNSARDYITKSAIDLHVYETGFLPLLGDLLNVFLDFAYHDYAQLWEARNYTDDSYSTYQHSVDLFEFLEKLSELDISEPLADRVSNLRETEEPLVIRSGHGTTHTRADTMAVYFPNALDKSDPISADYPGLAFAATLWDEFLNETKSPVRTPRVISYQAPVMDNITGPYAFTVNVDSPDTTEAEFHYRLNAGTWSMKPMTSASTTYTCTLAGQPNGTVIDYYFLARTSGREVTEPYDMKWTGNDFHQTVIEAYCDVAVTGISISPMNQIHNDTPVTITVECSNNGPQDASVNITAELTGEGQTIGLGHEQVSLTSGSSRTVDFHWVGINGTWSLSVEAAVDGKHDIDLANQDSTFTIEVTPLEPNVAGSGLGDWAYILIFLMIMTSIPFLAFIVLHRKARVRRRELIARSLRSARQMIATAEEFDIDASSSYMMLAKAEVALSEGRFNEAERLASEAKERAILAVGGEK